MGSVERTTERQRDQFVAFAFASAEVMFEVDEEGVIVFAVGLGRKMLGCAPEDLVGRRLSSLFRPVDWPVLDLALDRLPEGQRMIARTATVRDTGASARIGAFKASFLDSSVQLSLDGAEGLSQATERADVDEETGVLSAESFRRLASMYIEQDRETAQPHAMSLIELRGLARLKDERSEEAVRGLLAKVGASLRLASGSLDLAGRLGDGAFAVLHDADAGDEVGELLAHALSSEGAEEIVEAKTREVDLHSGVLSSEEVNQAMAYAIAEFAADPHNLNDVASLDSALQARLERAVEDIKVVKSMIGAQRFRLVYQPIVGLKDRSSHHFEALSRFEGDRSPYEVITFAEEVGVIAELDLVVIQKVLQFLVSKPPNAWLPNIAVNISARSLESDHFIEAMRRALVAIGRRRKLVMFEITESTQIRNLERANQIIQKLRDDGNKICLDDFGAGAAALHYIRNLQVDYVKLDGDYVRRFIHNPRDASIIKAMTSLCADIKVRTIAEMIETEEQRTALLALGVDFGQGYLFGKPAPDLPELGPPIIRSSR